MIISSFYSQLPYSNKQVYAKTCREASSGLESSIIQKLKCVKHTCATLGVRNSF